MSRNSSVEDSNVTSLPWLEKPVLFDVTEPPFLIHWDSTLYRWKSRFYLMSRNGITDSIIKTAPVGKAGFI